MTVTQMSAVDATIASGKVIEALPDKAAFQLRPVALATVRFAADTDR